MFVDWYPALEKTLSSAQAWDTFLANFKKCSTDEDRIRQLCDLTQVDDIVKTTPAKKGKSAEESVILRDQGNQVFKKGYKQRALDLYNLSVLKAPTSGDTSALALALANRSAVLLHMKHYRLSLQDIESSFRFGYPEKLKYKLLERKGKCYFQLNEKDKAKDAFEKAKIGLRVSGLEQEKTNNLINDYDKQVWHCEKLERPPSKAKSDTNFHGPVPRIGKENAVINSMSDALAVLFSQDSGRGLVSMRDIDIGELLVVEKPFSSTLLPGFSLSHCNNCCNRVISPVPCTECSEVIYCNDACRNTAWDTFHKYECDVLSCIREAEIGLGHLAVRTVLKAGLDMLSAMEDKPMTEKEQIRAGFTDDGMYDSQSYSTVYNLVNHTADRSTENLIKHSLEAVYLLKCIEKTSFFGNTTDTIVSSAAGKFLVGGHILRQLQMLPCNAHEVSELAMKPKNMPESVTMEIGSAIYPVLSLINHSCDPSVVRHSYGDICVVRAIRNIPKGVEIFDNYGALYPLTQCIDRREKLSKQYYFFCKCPACEDDYPLYFDTPSEVPVFKCESCLGPVFVPVGQKPDKAACSSCKMPQDISMKLAMLAKSDESYRAAIQQVLMDKSGNLDGYIPTLELHLKLMDRFLCRPWRDYNDCQEALKQCYAVKASHCVVE